MRAARYARYSTDQQRDTSIDDQLSAHSKLAERIGVTVTATYVDAAVSGTRRDRHDFVRMLNDARSGSFDVLILWDLKRLSRGEDLPQLLAQLKFWGVRVVTCDGFDSTQQGSKMRGWFEGMVGNQYLEDLAISVHRGLTGQFDRGMFAGGMAYGYTTIETPGGRQIQIDEKEAAWVRWILEQYASGKSTRTLANELNGKSVPSPRGGTWAGSAIYGHPKKGTGIIHNELYVGRYIWNRTKWVKDPETGRRKRIDRPEHEWKVAERPELRIVTDELWNAVRERARRLCINGGSRGKGKRPTSLFGGILRCGICGGPMVAISLWTYGCSTHKERGNNVCAGVFSNRKVTESRILSAMRDKVLSPESIAIVQQEVKRIAHEQSARSASVMNDTKSRLKQLEREIANLVDGLAASGWSTSIAERLAKAENERDQLRKVKPQTMPSAGEKITNILGQYKTLLADLPGALQRHPDEARSVIREMLGEIPIKREGERVYAEIAIQAERLLLSAGAVDRCGSGGLIPNLSTVVIWLN